MNGHCKLRRHDPSASKMHRRFQTITKAGVFRPIAGPKSPDFCSTFLVAARAVLVFSFGSDPAATNAKPDCSSKIGTHFADCSALWLAHDSTTAQVHFLRTDENHVQAVRRTRLPSGSSFWQPGLWTTGLEFHMLKSASAEGCADRGSRSLNAHTESHTARQSGIQLTYDLHTTHYAGALQYLRAGIRSLAAKRRLQNKSKPLVQLGAN